MKNASKPVLNKVGVMIDIFRQSLAGQKHFQSKNLRHQKSVMILYYLRECIT